MSLKLSTFNLNNLFERAKILNIDHEEQSFSATTKEVLNDVSALCKLLEKPSYDGATGEKIKDLLKKYFVTEPYKKAKYFAINEIRGKLFKASKTGMELVAKGKEDWMGFVEFTKVATNDIAVVNTARVIDAVNPDIICTVEVDNRLALEHFSDLIWREFKKRYKHYMLIDGNDDRGIDVGILSKFDVVNICSHVDDEYKNDNGGISKVFSRDCAEYTVQFAKDKQLHLLCNHFKSKGYGPPAESAKKRKVQAERVKKILSKYDLKKDFVAVAGDMNDTPDSEPLQPLLSTKNLHDVLDYSGYNGTRATYHTGSQQIDYLLVSQPLFDAISEVGVERRGIFKKNNEMFPEVSSKRTQASDHAMVWAVCEV
jgi:endonuclease/exonuclease/phosphatase family metal-dependent hydrolase